jgi:hypothetical protein
MKNTPKEIKDYGKKYARSLYTFLTGKRKESKSAFFNLKSHLNYPDLCQAVDYLEKNMHQRHKQNIFGNPLPKDYSELGVSEFTSPSKDMLIELNWVLISIRKYSYEINLFLIYKDDFERNLLIGNYKEAENFLTKIENEICFSLWTLENRFLLKELQGKSSENKDFLNHFNFVNKSNGLTKSLANFLSQRTERTLSVSRYNAELIGALSKLGKWKEKEHVDYYLFKLSFLNHLNYENFGELISYDFEHSIIDRYLNLRNVFSILITTVNQKYESVEGDKIIKDYIHNRINYLLNKIKDPILSKLKLFTTEKLFPAFNNRESQFEIQILDKYTVGLYKDVENELSKYLIHKTNQFDLYVLYVKSLIYQKKQFIPIGSKESLQNKILNDLYKIISATGNPNDASLNLVRIANNLTGFVLSYGLIDFVNHRTKGKEERGLLAKLSYNVANPIIHESLKEDETKVRYLEFLQNKFPDSITVDFLLCKIKDFNRLEKFQTIIPEVRYKMELAKGLQLNLKYEEAINVWIYIKENYGDTIPFIELAIKNLYICYEATKQYDDCIKLYVNSYFINSFLINKIEVESLIRRIKENRFKVVSPIIELPIFYTIANADENELHTTFEKFNLINGVSKPSELLGRFDDFDFKKITYFLNHSCGLEVLKHSTNIDGSKERLEERLTIIQFLKDKDSSNKERYDAEIKYISNILVIQKGQIDLDDGKIYVNEQGIFNNELKEYESDFNRYMVIAGLNKKNSALYLMGAGKLTQLNYDEDNKPVKIEYSSNPVFDIYIEMFEAIKDKFLYSKDGIVAYLSTRIRHGVLLGEIRPVFEKNRLITQKEGDSGVYRRNYYWDSKFNNENPHSLDIMQSLLKEFSSNIDGLIFDLITSNLQVYDKENNINGWFNYDFDQNELFWHSVASFNLSEYPDFVGRIFEILWERTDENLTVIREKILGDILDKFNELFNELEGELIRRLGQDKMHDLISSIKNCSTETQVVIKRISSWFKRSGTSASDFELENLIDIVVGYTDKSKKINLEKTIDCNCKIKGTYLKHFADLLWIFTENILKHSEEKALRIKAKISTSKEDENLMIKIENEITNKRSVEAIKKLSVNEHEIDTNKLISEGKSGYHKASKILKYDLMNVGNNFNSSSDENDELYIVNLKINLSQLLS